MKLRKIFALLMTLVMMLGMMPTAGASAFWCPDEGLSHSWGPTEWPKGTCSFGWHYCTRCGAGEEVNPQHKWQNVVQESPDCFEPGWEESVCSECGDEKGDGHAIPALGHSWYTRVNEQPTCTEEGWQEIICSRCDSEQGNPQRIPPLGHNWSGWSVAEKATCKGTGREVSSCSRCGISESRNIPALGHDWTAWYTENEPTCTERGTTRMDCERCGTYSFNYLEPTGHAFGEWHVTVEPQPGIPGEEQRECSKCGLIETRELTALEGEQDISTPSLTLSLSSTPANGTHFVVGEEVTFTEHWSNGTGKTLYPFSASIWTCGTPVFGSEIDQICSWFAEDAGGPVAPGASGSHSLTVTVTEADVARGAIYAAAEVLSTVQDGPDVPNVYTPFVSAPCGPELELPTVTFNKHILTTPANGEYFVAGEEIEYCLEFDSRSGDHAFNRGGDESDAVYDIGLYDPLHSSSDPIFLDDRSWDISMPFYYTVTEADVERGYVENTAYVTFSYQPGGEQVTLYSNTVTAPCGFGVLSADGLELTLVLSSTPANGTHFVVGEEVTFTETWANNTDKTLYPFSVSIFTCAAPAYGSEVDQICSWFAEDAGGPVAPGASGSHTLTVTVTEADVARGAIYAQAELLSTVQDGPDLENVATPYVTAPCGPDDSGDFGLSACLSVTKKVTGTPANGSYYEPGEDITFVITVTNQGVEQLLNVNVIDPLGGGLVTVLETLNVGETRDITVVFTTTDIVALAGSVDNGACVKAVDQAGQQYVEYSNIVTVPCGYTYLDATITPDNPFGIFHSLAVIKREESLPMNGEFYTEGEVIHYSITYTNDGELPLTDVQVWDNLDINTDIGHAEMLQPGESRTCYYQHTVTAADVDAGGVLNLAQATYPVPGGEGTVGVNSNLVFSKTSIDGMHCIVLPPLFPEGDEDPEYDPGTGWFPTDDPIIEGDTPPFGTIDTDTLRNGESYCVRAITGRDNVSADYETTFCSVHSPMQSAALMMAQAAAAPETQMQAAAYAVTLWRAEVEKLHQEIYEAADPAAKMVVMTEYIRFMTEAANFETMLNMLYPDQPALVAQKVAAMWENKCIDLCYDMHAAAADRKDSLLAVTPAVGAVSESCSCEVTAQENGKKNEKQSYCPVHGFPFSMIDALLQGNDTAERWTMVRQIWGVELTSAYNNVYTAMGDNKLLAMAEYNALTQWMMAREAYLIALYPENPEIVVQIMVKTIMERVNVLCEMFN